VTSTATVTREEAVAARAVAHALRPSHRALIEQKHGDASEAIETSMREQWHQEDVAAFWTATGRGLVAALEQTAGLTEGDASFMVGAALHATLLGGQDKAPDAILRVAERAACWDAGRRWVADRIT
jgi:hypothetical protein